MIRSHRHLGHGQPCPYCQRPMERNHLKLQPTRDHVVPESQGGRAKVFACKKCNETKADMMPEVWQAFMAAFPNWWNMTWRQIRDARRTGFATPGFKLPRRMVLGLKPRDAPRKKTTRIVVPPELIYTCSKDGRGSVHPTVDAAPPMTSPHPEAPE